MSPLAKKFYTPEQYLELERKAEYRSEYHDGQIFPMSAVSDRHDRITVNLTGLLLPHPKGSNCRLRTAGVRLLVPTSGLFTYPDLSITCGEVPGSPW